MFDLSNEKTMQLIRVCNLYYIDGKSQQEIASMLSVSRSQISRMLTLARETGIVNISIKNPFSEEQKYEKWITQTFGILDAVVVDVPERERLELNRRLAYAMTELLEAALKDKTVLGVMAGSTINGISENIGYVARKGLTIVPLVGGVGSEGKWQANLNARNFGEKFKCSYLQLNAPVIVASKVTRDAFLGEPEIAHVLNIGKSCTTALVGIGQISPEATIIKTGFLNRDEIEELNKKGAVSSVCNSFLNEKGECIGFSAYSRMIGLSAEDLRRIPKVIGVAAGEVKAPAITAVLRGKWVDILVTSLETARAIRDYYHNAQGL